MVRVVRCVAGSSERFSLTPARARRERVAIPPPPVGAGRGEEARVLVTKGTGNLPEPCLRLAKIRAALARFHAGQMEWRMNARVYDCGSGCGQKKFPRGCGRGAARHWSRRGIAAPAERRSPIRRAVPSCSQAAGRRPRGRRPALQGQCQDAPGALGRSSVSCTRLGVRASRVGQASLPSSGRGIFAPSSQFGGGARPWKRAAGMPPELAGKDACPTAPARVPPQVAGN